MREREGERDRDKDKDKGAMEARTLESTTLPFIGPLQRQLILIYLRYGKCKGPRMERKF